MDYHAFQEQMRIWWVLGLGFLLGWVFLKFNMPINGFAFGGFIMFSIGIIGESIAEFKKKRD